MVLLIAVGALSLGGPLTKVANIDPVATLAWRCGLGYLVLLLLGRRKASDRASRLQAQELPALCAASLGFVGFIGFWTTSFRYIPMGPSTVIVSMAALFTFLVDGALKRSGFGWRRAAGVGAAIAAVVPYLWSSSELGSNVGRGVLLSLGGAVCGSVFLLAIARGKSKRNAMSTLRVVSAMSAVVAGSIAGYGGVLFAGINPTVIVVVLALAIVPHCLGQGLVVVLSTEGEPLLGAVAIIGETVGTSVLALLWFHQPLATVLVSIVSFGVALVLIMGDPKASPSALVSALASVPVPA